MLIYKGKGEFIPGIPAHDLTSGEVKKYGGEEKLTKNGLYEKPKKKKEVKNG